MRRRLLAATVIALLAGFAVAAVSGVANLGARLAEGRPEWLILAGAMELISALGFVATFAVVFGEWLAKRTSLRVGLVVRAATIVLPAGDCSRSVQERARLDAGACLVRRPDLARSPSC